MPFGPIEGFLSLPQDFLPLLSLQDGGNEPSRSNDTFVKGHIGIKE